MDASNQEAGAGRGAPVTFRRFTAILNLMASCNGAQREDMSFRLPRRRKRREELADAFQALSLTTSSIPP